MPVQPIVSVRPEVRAVASEEEQLRLERFKKYHPPTYSGLATEDAHGFLEKCHSILRTMGIVETSGVSFITFQILGAAYQWWEAYKEGSPANAASLTWAQLSEMFLRDFVPQTLRDAWSTEFEQLRQGTMTVSEYAISFKELSRHAPTLVSTVRERVCRFIEGLNYVIRFNIDQELEADTPYQQVVEIVRRSEGMRSHEREDREAKGPRDYGGYNGARAPTATYYGRGYVSRPVHLALPASTGAPATPRSQVAHFAQLLSSVHPARGAFSGQSSRPGQGQFQ
ncbi:uncharacterized protein [Nicotiana tomentosiformis]|uniref:uncharacterized protein n=1 Tax=Nicotiana tomentosiformis TaxID=4098 RepID=UPI00388C8883